MATTAPYALLGPQVEPQASYWNLCSKLHVVTAKELTDVTDDPANPHFFPPYPDPSTPKGGGETQAEIDELLELAGRRDDPCALWGAKTGKLGERKPISKLLNLVPPALGAVLVNRFPGEQIIRTGRGMARAVEGETPGLYHRQALNYLISTRHWSPPRQALIWAALDVVIASALQAAWYYKWASTRPFTAYRQRPIEYAAANKLCLNVLFDSPDELNPAYNLCPDARNPATVSSGTPRHPAYPSGHSTYSGAASEFLAFFFGSQNSPRFLLPHPELGSVAGTSIRTEVENMADNIGLGRMWAGIHWRSDHENGMKLGRAVARLVIQQLADMGIELCPPEPQFPQDQCDPNQIVQPCDISKMPPKPADIQADAKKWQTDCGPKPTPTKGCPPPTTESIDRNRGVQRGAR